MAQNLSAHEERPYRRCIMNFAPDLCTGSFAEEPPEIETDEKERKVDRAAHGGFRRLSSERAVPRGARRIPFEWNGRDVLAYERLSFGVLA
jgi:hypothetical protein